jgi:hypothetical protein
MTALLITYDFACCPHSGAMLQHLWRVRECNVRPWSSELVPLE